MFEFGSGSGNEAWATSACEIRKSHFRILLLMDTRHTTNHGHNGFSLEATRAYCFSRMFGMFHTCTGQ
jgi:hypothetical protein